MGHPAAHSRPRLTAARRGAQADALRHGPGMTGHGAAVPSIAPPAGPRTTQPQITAIGST
jgi:hypothetical protein